MHPQIMIAADTNHDGMLSFEEFAAALRFKADSLEPLLHTLPHPFELHLARHLAHRGGGGGRRRKRRKRRLPRCPRAQAPLCPPAWHRTTLHETLSNSGLPVGEHANATANEHFFS
jgi:hypothetical protein